MSELDIELASLLDSLIKRTGIHAHRIRRPNERRRELPIRHYGLLKFLRRAALVSPCALLQALTHWYDPDAEQLQTTCGEYLELIFIHREAFAARPSAHAACSAAFSALARALELRAWRADRDADTEAVAAFRHEAWMVAAWMSSGGPWWRGGEKADG
ncbi:hypothetical protein B0F90DRAFT_1816552 [Multifurca ochricompacta]|uniref:Uncharacterized protein n=1 Tax=Multifurca ochricompacta TaxID=376703 RepID=A0AAD4M7G7_9AGAM|nr:hypothetical protein B0F90DRAFT_1816552 [Multifurca ochricompacta]